MYQDDCESSSVPCPEDQRRTPACEVELPEVLRGGDFFDKPLVISFWFGRGGDCLLSQDLVDEAASRYRGRVNFLSLNVRDDRDEVREVIRERGWRIPVGYDADGAVSNIYRVGVCPTVALRPGRHPGGARAWAARSSTTGRWKIRIARLLRESRRRARTDR